MKRLAITVYGTVQGVFYRASAKEKADELGIKGTVRNNTDGSVAIEAEGEDEQLQYFLSWCKRGPKLAKVDRCDVKEDMPRNFNDFSVLR